MEIKKSPNKKEFIHKSSAKGGWQRFSLLKQLANIGSEVGRAKNWRGRDEKLYKGAIERGLELFDLTLSDPRWTKGQLTRVAHLKEEFCDAISDGSKYGSSLEELDDYFLSFAFAARRDM